MLIRKIKHRFAALCTKKGLINDEQVIDALKIQVRENIEEKTHRPIGEILMELGYMNKKQVEDILNMIIEPRFGDIAISKRFISVEQLVHALSTQVKEESGRKEHRMVGEILMDHGYMSSLQVQETLNAIAPRTVH
jgi:hypothetical protein